MGKSDTLYLPASWSPNGKTLALVEYLPANCNIVLLSQTGNMGPFVNTKFDERYPVFSPDGNWIAYSCNEQEQDDIYVQPYPPNGNVFRVSFEGGEEPIWSSTKKEIYYRDKQKWMVATYTTKPTFQSNVPQLLFQGDYVKCQGRSYDVTSDGQRFLVVEALDKSSSVTQLRLVNNWFEELKQ